LCTHASDPLSMCVCHSCSSLSLSPSLSLPLSLCRVKHAHACTHYLLSCLSLFLFNPFFGSLLSSLYPLLCSFQGQLRNRSLHGPLRPQPPQAAARPQPSLRFSLFQRSPLSGLISVLSSLISPPSLMFRCPALLFLSILSHHPRSSGPQHFFTRRSPQQGRAGSHCASRHHHSWNLKLGT
jgi:hypothetical protein